MTWKVGDIAVCIVDVQMWTSDIDLKQSVGPKYLEENKVDRVISGCDLVFNRYGSEGYQGVDFRKKVDHKAKWETKTEKKQPKKETQEA